MLLIDLPIGKAVNSLGLFLDICGALLLWRFGLPEILDRKGNQYLITGKVDQADVDRAAKYNRWSQVGLFLLISGFLLQLISNFLSSPTSQAK